jgi:hypothetical protein
MKKCEHEWRVKVELFLDIPLELSHRINKKAIARADVRIEGANWPKARTYCAKCGASPKESIR